MRSLDGVRNTVATSRDPSNDTPAFVAVVDRVLAAAMAEGIEPKQVALWVAHADEPLARGYRLTAGFDHNLAKGQGGRGPKLGSALWPYLSGAIRPRPRK